MPKDRLTDRLNGRYRQGSSGRCSHNQFPHKSDRAFAEGGINPSVQ